MLPPFAAEARNASSSQLDLQLALAAEFGPVHAEGTRSVVADLAELVACTRDLRREDQLAGLGHAMASFRRIADDIGLDDLLVDRVVVRRAGTELALAALAVAVATEAGVPVRVVGDGRRHLVVHDDLPGLVLDTSGWRTRLIGREARRELRGRCAHHVASAVLERVAERLARAGDVGRALHASELRLSLPLAGPLRTRVEAERNGLRASLN